MRVMRNIFTGLLILAAFCIVGHGQEWRKITPLKSTCEDAKLLLGIKECHSQTVVLEDESVNIDFAEKPCFDGWNVPAGTVIGLTVYSKKKALLKDLNIDLTKYEKTESVTDPDHTVYFNAEEGIGLTVTPDGKVESISYEPLRKDYYLRYPTWLDNQSIKLGSGRSSKFDEYGAISFSKAKQRLKDVALHLQHNPNIFAYIVYYGGRQSCIKEAERRAQRAKEYLIDYHKILLNRIETIEGGYRADLTIEVFTGPRDSAPITQPTICPEAIDPNICNKPKQP